MTIGMYVCMHACMYVYIYMYVYMYGVCSSWLEAEVMTGFFSEVVKNPHRYQWGLLTTS